MRKQNTIKNFITSIIPYFIFTLLSIFKVKLFLNKLGDDIYASNQLFSQLFTYISLVEGGVGALIVQKYYKYFISKSYDEINRIYSLSIKAMKNISMIIFSIGLVLSFFIKFLTNNSLSFFYLQFVFILYDIRSVIEYLNLSPRFVIQADQKLYKINITLNLYKLLEIVIEILLLFGNFDYAIILLLTIVIRIVMYYCVNRKIKKEYPWLKRVETTKSEKIVGMGYMFWHKIAGNIKTNTDVILLSITQNSFIVSCYASYHYIIKCIGDVIYMMGTAVLSSYGNVVYSEGNKKSFDVFKKINLSFLFFASTFSVICYIVINKFIGLWVGEKYILDNIFVILIIVSLFHTIANRSLKIVSEARGLYKETKNIVATEALINLLLSIILVKKYSMLGVLAATVVSDVYNLIEYPRYIYKNVFKEKTIYYFLQYISVAIFSCLLVFVIYNIPTFVINNYYEFILYACIVSLITFILIFIFFYMFFVDFKFLMKDCLKLMNNKNKSIERK